MKPRIVDIDEVQRALDSAARDAKRGSSELRAGKVLVGRDKSRSQRVMRRDKAPVRPSREKR